MTADTLIDRIAAARPATGTKALQIYLHVPFCSAKCHFCDWVDDIPVAQLRSGPEVRRRYAEALCRQIAFWGPPLTALGYAPRCIYWGGGTPTRLDPDDFDRIGAALAASFDLSGLEQHTMESTPSDLTPEKLDRIVGIGVDRLSIGVQSFDPEQLRRAGRAHSAEQAGQAVALARQAGLTDVNIDLISGFPDEDLATFKRTLDRTAALEPSHVSVYSYRATPRTTMAIQATRGIRQALDLDGMIESYELAQEVLSGAGYEEYCFNYFAREPKWRFTAGLYGYQLDGDIIGFGAGAGSTIGAFSLTNQDTQLPRFMDDPLLFDDARRFTLAKPEMFFPLFGGALMTRGGLSFEKFAYLTGVSFDEAWATPDIRAWFQYVENCGAKLAFEPDRLVSADRNIHRVYLRNLSYTLNPVLLKQS